ncbi:MAG: biopolymer transporter Tol, partial [Planctomycetota bacterium]
MFALLTSLAFADLPADWQKQEAVHLKNIRQVTHDFVR